ncbi:DUF1624 domain-containing protein [Defluviimonas sp. WL0002]|uniref:DUF1624 domain-containing protein n=1 Tax=Albidovulum marisflavi TaxID=2984159 RepID=A0ABT2ZC04_9RHOB|nr:heparan-alpha-glucosaminide N-acetyltransferase [Defluviimonas sp. WL0002]MCV2868552.1 DUF1624 domain-containing protein [Defluviimonas sp. WL0002]
MATAQRIVAVDLARGGALVGMVAFHLTYDLAIFGFIDAAVPFSGFWWVLARAVAGAFLFLAGVSMWLAHGRSFRPRAFLRRLAVLIAAAMLVSAATWLAMPGKFVYFGILHSVAAASILGLIFLRVPALWTAIASGLVLFAPAALRDEAFNSPWLWWTGLSTVWRAAADFEPVLPWFAPFLAGMALGQTGVLKRLPLSAGGMRALRPVAWAGRHSLMIYLVHQPILIGLVWCVAQLLHRG